MSLSRDSKLGSEPSWVCAKKLKSSATSPPRKRGRSANKAFTSVYGYTSVGIWSPSAWVWGSGPERAGPPRTLSARPPFTQRSALVLTALQGKVQWQWVAVIWMRTNKNRKKAKNRNSTPAHLPPTKEKEHRKQKCTWKQQWCKSQTHVLTHTHWAVVSSETNLTDYTHLSPPRVTWWRLVFRKQ